MQVTSDSRDFATHFSTRHHCEAKNYMVKRPSRVLCQVVVKAEAHQLSSPSLKLGSRSQVTTE